MRNSTVAPERRERGTGVKNLVQSLVIGIILGAIIGAPIGWFSHRLFAQQRAAQVLLCRQQHYGQPEADLQATCGTVY
jgi:NhaP-type Na+/H+ or K+/H+ antiporter